MYCSISLKRKKQPTKLQPPGLLDTPSHLHFYYYSWQYLNWTAALLCRRLVFLSQPCWIAWGSSLSPCAMQYLSKSLLDILSRWKRKLCSGFILSYDLCQLTVTNVDTGSVTQSILKLQTAMQCTVLCSAHRSWWLGMWRAGCVACAAKAEIKGGRTWEHQLEACWGATVVRPHQKGEPESDLPSKINCVMNKHLVGLPFFLPGALL